VRIRLRLNRRGNPPSLTCTTLTEEAVQTEIDASLVFRRTLEAMHKQKSYGAKPWVVEVDVQFLGSDGKAIDAPAPAEISYFGPEEPDGAQPARDSGPVMLDSLARVLETHSAKTAELLIATMKELPGTRAQELLCEMTRKLDERNEQLTRDLITATAKKPSAESGGGMATLTGLFTAAAAAKKFLN
jgi:hypothetical protein